MDGPTWWNNRLWRTGSLREDRPSSGSSQRLAGGHNMNTFNTNASTQQAIQSSLNVHPGQTSAYTIPPRQREKKLIRPNFRPSTPKREGRPLAAMRINFFNGISTNDELPYNTTTPRSGTPSNLINRASPSMSSVVYGRSLTPSPMSNYTVYSRPNSVGVVYPKPQPSVMNSSLSLSTNHRHDENGIPSTENYHSLQNISFIASNGNPTPHPFRSPTKEVANKSSNPSITFIRNGTHPVGSQLAAVTTSLNAHSAAALVNGNATFPSNTLLQSRQNVIASRFGRRVLRPNVTIVSNEDEDNSDDDVNDTISTHSSNVIHNISVPHETQTPFINKHGSTKSPTSNSPTTISTTIASKPPLPSSSSSASIQKSPGNADSIGRQTSVSNNENMTGTSSNSYTNSMAIIRGNLWQGNSQLKELVLVPSQNAKLESKPLQIQETYPVRSPLKSILKKSNSFISGLTQQQSEGFSGFQPHIQDDEAHKDNGPSLSAKPIGTHSSLSLNHGSKENLPQTSNSHAATEDRRLHQNVLLRRSLQSAPSLKRAVRFNMGQNAVLEFHATENHFSTDDGDYL